MKKLLALCCLLISCATTSVTTTVKEPDRRKSYSSFSVTHGSDWAEFYGDLYKFSPRGARTFGFGHRQSGSLIVVSVFFQPIQPTLILEPLFAFISTDPDFAITRDIELTPDIHDAVAFMAIQKDPPLTIRCYAVSNNRQTILIQALHLPDAAVDKLVTAFIAGFEIAE